MMCVKKGISYAHLLLKVRQRNYIISGTFHICSSPNPTQAHLYSSHETSINTHMHALLRASDKTHTRTHRRQHRARGSVRPLGIAIHQYVRISFSSSSAAKCCGNCVGMSRAHTHTRAQTRGSRVALEQQLFITRRVAAGSRRPSQRRQRLASYQYPPPPVGNTRHPV